jgi:hypothetical protein
MKQKTVTSILGAVLFLSACQGELEKDITFDLTAVSQGGYWEQDTLVVHQSENILFNFSGNPEFISFFSGEPGHEYDKRNMTEYSPGLIDKTELSFGNMPRYGTIAGTLSVFLSTSFPGMLGNDKQADSLAILQTEWFDITAQCNLSTTSNSRKETLVSLTEYKDQELTLAFRYKTTQNTAVQPNWFIYELQIANTLTTGEKPEPVKAVSMGFSALDMYNETNPYASALVGYGLWDLTNITSGNPPFFIIRSSPVDNPLNDDWLISQPLRMNRRLPDRAIGVKSLSDDIFSCEYAYAAAGIYSVHFIASRTSYSHSSEAVKSFFIKVIE